MTSTVNQARGPEEIRAAFTTAIDTAGGHAEDLTGIAGVLDEAAERYEALKMTASTLERLRAGAAAVDAAAAALGTAGEQLQAALADFNHRDGLVADVVAEVGNLMQPGGYTTPIPLSPAPEQEENVPAASTARPGLDTTNGAPPVESPPATIRIATDHTEQSQVAVTPGPGMVRIDLADNPDEPDGGGGPFVLLDEAGVAALAAAGTAMDAAEKAARAEYRKLEAQVKQQDTPATATDTDVDIGPGGLWLGDVNAGVVSWSGRGPAGGRSVEIEDGDGGFAAAGLTREQMRELRDRFAATLAGEPVDGRMATDDGALSWQTDGDGYRLRAGTSDEHCEVVLTGAQLRAVQQQIAADLAEEDAAAATFPGVTGRLADKHAGVSYDNDSQLTVPDGALTDEQTQACGRAVRLYRNSTYRKIGAYLRGGEDEVMQVRERPGQTDATAEAVSEHVAQIDQAMQASPLDQPIELWRGVRDLPLVLGTEPDKDLTGTQWTEQSFPSTSVDPKVADLFAGDDTLLRLHVPAGTGAIQLDSRPTKREHTREAEVLLQRDLQMRVIGDQRQTVGEGHTAWSGGSEKYVPPREYRVLDVEVTVPRPAVPEPSRSAEEIRPPNGGHGIDQGLMHFDSALGMLWNRLGDDQHLQVDGHALGNVITDLGEGITRRHHDTNHALRELRRIRTQLPDTSTAAQRIDTAVNRLDAPDRPAPALPDNAPQQLKTLMADLNAIPLVRRGYDDGSSQGSPFHETDQLAEAATRWLNGEITRGTLEREIGGLARRRHESSEGWTEIRTAVSRALSDFRQWAKRPT